MFGRIFGFAVLTAATAAMAANAQSGRDPYVPAELPPESFTGVQYVDSTGCAFIRAGFGGQVNWVPRFDQDRNPVCGLVPTFQMAEVSDESESTEDAPEVAAAPEPDPAPEPPAQAATESPIPPAKAPAARVAAAPATPAPAPAPSTHELADAPADHCPNYDPIGKAQSRTGAVPVRCGPQLRHPSDGRPTLGPGSTLRMSEGSAPRPIPVPEGYRPAWKDDRLNPYRGVGTAQGDAQMRRIWTDTVPAQLVEVPEADRPYTATVSTRSPSAAAPAPAETATPQRDAQPAQVGGYVQVGSFGVPANARGTVERFKAMGLPVSTRQMRSGGQSLQVVSIGPLAGQADLNAALQAARQAGFGDAFIRR